MQKTIGLWAGAWLLLAGSVHASDFQGQVALPNKRAAANAIITLEGAKKAAPLPKVIIDQREKMFSPHISVITVGTTVEFPNNDTVFHNVFAYFNAKKFDLGMYPRGATKRVTFDKTGLVALLCNVHSEMSAYIMVVDTPYYAIADRQGRFHLGNVPAGNYTLRVWHESGSDYAKPIEIKEGEVPLSLMLTRK